ncbi:MAG: hypothetical protein M3O64_04120 [Chloroflexota bacterium]|nr:hypothetical protein [Chloroflexota bacterium]
MRPLWRPLLLACALVAAACGAEAPAPTAPSASPTAARASPTAGPPVITLIALGDPRQAPRWVTGRWVSTLPLLEVRVSVTPASPFACAATLDVGRQSGTYECVGLLPASTDVRVELLGTGGQGAQASASRSFRTMGERLTGVPWFTEFEDPNGEALACAAASVRIIQVFTMGRDVATARQILERGMPLNKSADPGIDPAAIAAVISSLEPANRYHYYRYPTRESATKAAVYWLARSAKPVIALSLAGQHGPIITGYTGSIGPTFADAAVITGLVVEDPQRGDTDPATAKHRPDKSRSVEFQTGKLIGIAEWYGDEWWFRDAYKGSIVFNVDARVHDVDRNDGLYPSPHWDGTFVILVDDGDLSTPPDREGHISAR